MRKCTPVQRQEGLIPALDVGSTVAKVRFQRAVHRGSKNCLSEMEGSQRQRKNVVAFSISSYTNDKNMQNQDIIDWSQS